MKKIASGLLVIIGMLYAYVALAQTSRETLEKRKIENYVKVGSGNFTVDSHIDLNSKSILNGGTINGSFQGPGMVPIGGMVPVMSHLAGSWVPPVTGVVKDGFMRADGALVADAGSPLNGVTLPNMTGGTYPRGDTTSSSTSGGANTQASNVTVGNHTALSLSNHSDIDIAHGHSFTNGYVPAHYHSEANHSTGLTAAGQAFSGTTGNESAHTHSIDPPSTSVSITDTGHAHSLLAAALSQNGSALPAYSSGGNGVGQSATASATTGITATVNIASFASAAGAAHNHSFSGTASASGVTGFVGEDTGGCSGDSGATCQTTGGAVTALGVTNKSISAHSFSQNISAHSVTNNAVNNEPKYLPVVWVIRVK